MTASPNIKRPLPNMEDPLYAPYFQALKEHTLAAQRCKDCGHMQMPPREFCFHCHGTHLGWTEVPQRGELYTYTIVYRAFHPWFENHLPYGVLVVELDNGLRMMGNYFGADVEMLACGTRMKAQFETVNEEITLLHWEKEEAS